MYMKRNLGSALTLLKYGGRISVRRRSALHGQVFLGGGWSADIIERFGDCKINSTYIVGDVLVIYVD